ncbi:MAG: DNA translocase FtsK [Pseudomonadota bacterium]
MSVVRNITPDFYIECLKAVVEHQRCSKNFIQKHMKCSFEKADAIIWAFEKAGYISCANEKNRRRVIADEFAIEALEQNMARDEARLVTLQDEMPIQSTLAPYAPPAAYRREIKWSEEIEDQIIDQIVGGYTIEKICENPEMPSRATVMRWLNGEGGVKNGASFKARYDQARIARADRLAAEIILIGDDSSRDRIIKTLPGGVQVERVDSEHIQRSKLRCDNRRWLLQTLFPERFAARMIVNHKDDRNTGAKTHDFGPVIGVVKNMTTEALRLYTALCRQLREDYAEGKMPINIETDYPSK